MPVRRPLVALAAVSAGFVLVAAGAAWAGGSRTASCTASPKILTGSNGSQTIHLDCTLPPGVQPTVTVTQTVTASPSVAASPSAGPSSTATASAGFPDATNTGVPAGTSLTAYTGPMTITTDGTQIDARTITGDLVIQAANVQIIRSRIIGTVATDENSTGYSYSISDSTVQAPQSAVTGVGAVNFTATRIHVTGGNRSINCWHDCTITDSYVHGQFTDKTGVAHESGIRMGSNTTLRHNSIACDAPDVPPDAGCSADLTGYGDFGPVQNNIVDHNQFLGTTGGYCAYGGSSSGKPYSSQVNHISFTRNVFARTRTNDHGKPDCGYYGSITAFDSSAPGNIWSGNTYTDGTVVPPSN